MWIWQQRRCRCSVDAKRLGLSNMMQRVTDAVQLTTLLINFMEWQDSGSTNIWGFTHLHGSQVVNVLQLCAAAVHTLATLLRQLTAFRRVSSKLVVGGTE